MEALLPDQIAPVGAIVLIIASFFTSALTAAAGIGGGLLMLALMTYIIPISALIPVHGIVQLGSNASRTWIQRAHVEWKIMGIFLLGSLLGALCGIFFVTSLPETVLNLILGVFILFMVWIKIPAITKAGSNMVFAGGTVTTFISMFVGATGPLVAVFLNKLFENHRQMVATHGASMVAQHGFKIAAFGVAGFAFGQWLPLIALMIISGFLGAKAGTVIMNRLPDKTLKLAFKIIISAIALDMLRRAIF